MTKEEKDVLPVSREMTTEERARYFVKRLLDMQKEANDVSLPEMVSLIYRWLRNKYPEFETEIKQMHKEDQNNK